MSALKNIFPVIVLFLILASCNRFRANEDETILARVQDEYLYASDIEKAIPKGISARDSLTMARSMVNKWIEKTILLNKAQNNLTDSELDFEEQLKKYRNSLIIYNYETKLIRQKLDTVVSDEEIRSYYQDNKRNFLLKNDILKVHYILLPLDFEEMASARRVFFNDENTNTIESYCKEHNLRYFLEDSWMYLNEVKQYLPLRIESAEEIKYSEREIKDSEFQYFIKIIDSRQAKEIKPLSLVRNDIRNIIVNQRKTRMIKNMHQDLVDEGFKNNDIEIY